MSQPKGGSLYPTSPAKTEQGESEEIPQISVEAHGAASQETDISSLDSNSLPNEQVNVEEIVGEAQSQETAVGHTKP